MNLQSRLDFGLEAKDAAAKHEFFELVTTCEDVADKVDDCRASGCWMLASLELLFFRRSNSIFFLSAI
jgi:hypothetical protein